MSSCRLRRLPLVLAGLALLLALGSAPSRARAPAAYPRRQPPSGPPEHERDRFGVNVIPAASIQDFDVERLGATWYLNWLEKENPPQPNGAWFMQTLRLEQGERLVSDERVRDLIRANPGAVWQIGNEPDSPWLDNTQPDDYAVAYHHLHELIKDLDPTARLANGGLVQATPLRIAYLDRIWQAYQRRYGEPMPVDVWTVHGFILREQPGGWGAEIPPGMDDVADLGMLYDLRDHDDLTIFAQQIRRFRQWMADHGQRHKPLWVNEYGILMPADILDERGHDFSEDRVIAFMQATFDHFRTATDPQLGHPADGDRLVQRWAWYSVGDNLYDADGHLTSERYNGDLFTGAVTKTLTALGSTYGLYVQGDLSPGALWSPAPPMWSPGQAVTATVALRLRKDGGLSPTASVDVTLRAAATAHGTVTRTLTAGPLGDGTTATLTATFPYTTPGAHPLTATVDPADAVAEVQEDNNVLTGIALVATDRLFLPLAGRGSHR